MHCPHCNRKMVDGVTPRQQEIIHQVVLGKTDKEVGLALDICEQTVKNHLWKLRERLGHLSRTALVVLALKKGWLKLEDLDEN